MTLETWQLMISVGALLVALGVAVYSWRQARLFSLLVLAWWAAAYALSVRGFFAGPTTFGDGHMLNFFVFGSLICAPLALFALAYWRSAPFRTFVNDIPLAHLTGFEVYRVGGAVFFWLWAASLVPAEMGFFTGAADVFIGLTALPLAWALARSSQAARAFATGWHIFGIMDFALAVGFVSLAILGVITPQPAPAMIGLHPLALISLFQMPLSIAVHGLALRQLMAGRQSPAYPRPNATARS